jgi:hypothetical protein
LPLSSSACRNWRPERQCQTMDEVQHVSHVAISSA